MSRNVELPLAEKQEKQYLSSQILANHSLTKMSLIIALFNAASKKGGRGESHQLSSSGSCHVGEIFNCPISKRMHAFFFFFLSGLLGRAEAGGAWLAVPGGQPTGLLPAAE